MCAMVGADVEALRDTAERMGSASRVLEVIERDLTARINGTLWVGEGADRFRSEWNRMHRCRMTSVSAALRSACSELLGEAEQQDEVSADGGRLDAGSQALTCSESVRSGFGIDDLGRFLLDLGEGIVGLGVDGVAGLLQLHEHDLFTFLSENEVLKVLGYAGDLLDVAALLDAFGSDDPQVQLDAAFDAWAFLASKAGTGPIPWLSYLAINAWGEAISTATFEIDWAGTDWGSFGRPEEFFTKPWWQWDWGTFSDPEANFEAFEDALLDLPNVIL